MIITNTHNYPEAVIKAVQAELYSPVEGVYRVTELIDSPLIRRLLMKYWDTLEVDADEIVYSSLLGSAWHKFLSSFEVNALVEKRWSMNTSGVIVTGQTDIYKPQDGIIEDNKTQSAWAFVFGNESWVRQLNLYAELVEQSGYRVKELWINALLRDWSRYEAMRHNEGYPDRKFHRHRVSLWDRDIRKKYLDERLGMHLTNKDYVCTDEERWRKKTTYAVKKNGVKQAKRVLDTEGEAKLWIEQNKPKGDIYIEKRVGGCIRCTDYCMCRSVCEYKD